MNHSIPDDCIPIIQEFLTLRDLLSSRLVSRTFVQRHVRLRRLQRYNSPHPVPYFLSQIIVGENVTNEILQKSPQIKCLKLNFNKSVIDDGIKNLKLLHTLSCSNLITNDGIRELAQLRRLKINGAKITDEGLVYLKKLNDLQCSPNTRITNNGIKHLKLKVLTCTKFMTDDGIKDMSSLKNLYCGQNITDRGIQTLVNLTILSCTTGVTEKGIKNLINLRDLRFSSGISISGLSHLKKLKILNVWGFGTIIDAIDLNRLQTLTTLKCRGLINSEHLNLPKLRVLDTSEKILPGLSKLVELRELSILKTQVCDEDLIGMTKMKKLCLGKNSQAVTDRAIINMPNLNLLHLGKSKITGKALECLSNLRDLGLGSSQLSDRDIENLKLEHLSLQENQSITKDCKLLQTTKYCAGRNIALRTINQN